MWRSFIVFTLSYFVFFIFWLILSFIVFGGVKFKNPTARITFFFVIPLILSISLTWLTHRPSLQNTIKYWLLSVRYKLLSQLAKLFKLLSQLTKRDNPITGLIFLIIGLFMSFSIFAWIGFANNDNHRDSTQDLHYTAGQIKCQWQGCSRPATYERYSKISHKSTYFCDEHLSKSSEERLGRTMKLFIIIPGLLIGAGFVLDGLGKIVRWVRR